jgi:hypothetical protein
MHSFHAGKQFWRTYTGDCSVLETVLSGAEDANMFTVSTKEEC